VLILEASEGDEAAGVGVVEVHLDAVVGEDGLAVAEQAGELGGGLSVVNGDGDFGGGAFPGGEVAGGHEVEDGLGEGVDV